MQDLVDPAQLSNLLTQPAVLLSHLGGGPVMTFTRVGLSMSDPVPQCLLMHVQLLGQTPDRRLRVRLAIQTHSTRPELVGIFPRCCHGYFLPMISRSCLRSSVEAGETHILPG